MTAIDDKWVQLAGENGPLGKAQGLEKPSTANTLWSMRSFANGVIYSDPNGAAFAVYGKIHDRWVAEGSEEFGLPATSELYTAGQDGRWNHFTWSKTIIWRPGIGTRIVEGRLFDKWRTLGSLYGSLGAPIAEEVAFEGGSRQDFTGGSIFFHSSVGSFALYGQILAKWLKLGGPASALGWPVTDEIQHEDRVTRFSRFENKTLVWTPTGGVEVHD